MSNGLAKRESTSLVPFGDEWAAMKEQAKILIDSGFLPAHLKSEGQVIAIMLAARDLKITPSVAIRNLFVVKGRVSMSADLMLALAYSRIPGFQFGVTESTAKAAEVWGQRPGGERVTTRWTAEDHFRAGLTDKDVYKQYPAQLLLARAKSANLRVTAADALAGVYTPEELGSEKPPQPTQQEVATLVDFEEVKDYDKQEDEEDAELANRT